MLWKIRRTGYSFSQQQKTPAPAVSSNEPLFASSATSLPLRSQFDEEIRGHNKNLLAMSNFIYSNINWDSDESVQCLSEQLTILLSVRERYEQISFQSIRSTSTTQKKAISELDILNFRIQLHQEKMPQMLRLILKKIFALGIFTKKSIRLWNDLVCKIDLFIYDTMPRDIFETMMAINSQYQVIFYGHVQKHEPSPKAPIESHRIAKKRPFEHAPQDNISSPPSKIARASDDIRLKETTSNVLVSQIMEELQKTASLLDSTNTPKKIKNNPKLYQEHILKILHHLALLVSAMGKIDTLFKSISENERQESVIWSSLFATFTGSKDKVYRSCSAIFTPENLSYLLQCSENLKTDTRSLEKILEEQTQLIFIAESIVQFLKTNKLHDQQVDLKPCEEIQRKISQNRDEIDNLLLDKKEKQVREFFNS